MKSPELKSVDCPACGAGLDILGGGRVTVHICPYCGTELDAVESYQILRRNSDLQRPESPFAIGQSGVLKGVSWVIIGTLGLRETYNGRVWDWVEHQLYSATHGYAWLVVEKGHLTFSRRQRHMPNPHWMGAQWVETAESKPTVMLYGERYTYYQTTTARLTFAEGEFTWSPRIGDVTQTVSALGDTHMLDFSETGFEREVYRSDYLDAGETLEAFGLDTSALRPSGAHPLKPFRTTPTLRFTRLAATGFAVLCLMLGIVLGMQPGGQVLSETRLDLSELPRSVSFDISKGDRLAGINFKGDGVNAWGYVDIELEGPEDQVVFEAGRSFEYYQGRDSDGTWSEGSNRASVRFLPVGPGTYTLTLSGAETGLWKSPGFQSRASQTLRVSAYEGLSTGRPLYLLMLGFGGLAALLWLRVWWHNMRCWSGSDWVEEDDD